MNFCASRSPGTPLTSQAASRQVTRIWSDPDVLSSFANPMPTVMYTMPNSVAARSHFWRPDLSLFVRLRTLSFLERPGKDVLENPCIHIGDRFDIQASSSDLVPPQLAKLIANYLQSTHQIEADVLLSRRKADQHPLAFSSACTHIVICPKSDNGASPHDGIAMSDIFHHSENFEAIVPHLPFFDLVQKRGDTRFGRFGLVLCHKVLLPTILREMLTMLQRKTECGGSSF